jgi:hypothetical protein
MRIPFGTLAPDLPTLDNPGALAALNVFPARGFYRPVPSLTTYSGAFAARVQGAFTTQDTSGNVNVFAGSAAKLQRLTGGSLTPEDVSGTTYTTASDELWSFATDGAGRVMACNYADPPQSYVIGTSTDFADLISSGTTSLKARYIAYVNNFVFFGNTTDGTDGARPGRVWWGKQGDPTNVPTPGTAAAIAAQSDFQDFGGDLGWVMGFIVGLAGAEILVLFERGVVRGTYVGGSLIWQFDIVEGARGTPAPGSILQIGGRGFYLGDDGWYETNGAVSEGIGASLVDKFFFADTTHGLDTSYYFRICAAADPENKTFLVAYPSVSGSAGALDRVLAFNWDSRNWSLISGLGDLEWIHLSRTLGYSLDTLDSLSGSIDALPYSLDSRQLTGGRLQLIAFKAADHIAYTFAGSALAATITTKEVEPYEGQRAMLTEAWPLVEGTSVTLTLTPIYRDRLNDAVTTGSAVTQTTTGHCPLRTSARFHRLQMDISSGGTWTKALGVMVPPDKVVAKGRR